MRIITEVDHFNICAKRAVSGVGTFAKPGESQEKAIKRFVSGRKREWSHQQSRKFPTYKPGMSTAEYVRAYEATSQSQPGLKCSGFWGDLNFEPAALYDGGAVDFAPVCELAECEPIAEPVQDLPAPVEAAPEALDATEAAPMSDCMAQIVATAAEPADDGGFTSRVNLAAAYIGAGRNTSRAFDSCFEMWDGAAVCVALLRRAEARPSGKLAANLYRYLAQHHVEAAAAEQPEGLSLAQWSRALIAQHAQPDATPTPPKPAPAPAEPAPLPDAPGSIGIVYPSHDINALPLSQTGPAAPRAAPPSGGSLKHPPAEAGIHPGVQKTQPDKPSALPESGAVHVPQPERWRAARAGLMLRRWHHWRGAAPPPVESAPIPPAEAGPGCTTWRAKDTGPGGLGLRPSSGGSLARRLVHARKVCGPPLARSSSPRLANPFT